MGLMLRPDYVSMDNMTMKARRKKKGEKKLSMKTSEEHGAI